MKAMTLLLFHTTLTSPRKCLNQAGSVGGPSANEHDVKSPGFTPQSSSHLTHIHTPHPNMAQLYGTCACERNQYTIIIPSDVRTHAQVFFDNSRDSRRTQASPVTAWLRVRSSHPTTTTARESARPTNTHLRSP